MSLSFRRATPADMNAITALLHEVFRPTYGHILTEPQIAFMLSSIFSQAHMEQQMNGEGHQFIMAYDGKQLAGFAALEYNFHKERAICKLHKLYLTVPMQGKGLGKALLQEVIRLAKENGQQYLILNVNRGNKAKAFYEAQGFHIRETVDIPLENGYYMNDYIMQLEL